MCFFCHADENYFKINIKKRRGKEQHLCDSIKRNLLRWEMKSKVKDKALTFHFSAIHILYI